MEVDSQDIIELLKDLIRIPSISTQEKGSADVIDSFLRGLKIPVSRLHNNLWVRNKDYNKQKPSILLNSHHDTVQPVSGWNKDPFTPILQDDKLYGLGSNDAGAALVCLLAVFLKYYDTKALNYNLIYLASAEEEISGPNGVSSVLNHLGGIDFGIVGEPTDMRMAVAEKGLMVIDVFSEGTSGHAARDVGDNAIYKAIEDIEWIRKFRFPKISETLGPVKINVTIIHGGTQHNVIPDKCEFVIDVRSTDMYSNEEILAIMADNMRSRLKPRSTRLQPSHIPNDHMLVQTAEKLGIEVFGSDTLSDQALMPFPTVKIGPGGPERSHTADEFIYIRELHEGIDRYAKLLDHILIQ